MAEETGQLLAVGQWALAEACRQMARWQEQFRPDPPLFVSVNLSGRQLTHPDLSGRVREALGESGLSPHSLQLEVTESVLAEGNETAFGLLATLGVGLCIDDFGAASSLLSGLHRLPASTLKVDRALIDAVAGDEESAKIVRALDLTTLWPLDYRMPVPLIDCYVNEAHPR